jgi:hypothetical protein
MSQTTFTSSKVNIPSVPTRTPVVTSPPVIPRATLPTVARPNPKAVLPVVTPLTSEANIIPKASIPSFTVKAEPERQSTVQKPLNTQTMTLLLAKVPPKVVTDVSETAPPEDLTPNVAVSVQPKIMVPLQPKVSIRPKLMAPVKPKVSELTLRPWQIEWANRAYEILTRNHGYIDTSRMGSGKTYVTLWLAKQFGFRLLIVCPVIMIEIWRKTAAEYGVTVIDVISYQTLRSIRNHQPKHAWLNRYDNITEGGIHQVSFSPTPAYSELIEQGIMVICDEIQNIKNNSDQYKACNALIRPITESGGRSRFGLLSGTPFDKEEHAVNLLRVIGYIRSHRLYTYVRETRELRLEGMKELIDACRFIDPAETNRILADIPLQKGQMDHMCYMLYTRVIKASISGAMPAPTNIQGRFDVKNGFYQMTGDKIQQLQAAINELASAVQFNERTGVADMRAENIGAVTTALVHIENAKALDFARVATQILMNDARNKVILCVNYTSTVEEIQQILVFYSPLILNGQVMPKKRGNIVQQFNENPAYRVLIMNTAVGGVGISLHDTRGDSPRYMLMSPSYKLLEVTQAAARIHRDGTCSDATVRMFYGMGAGASETHILTAMARKTQVLKGALETEVTQDLVLPGDYRDYFENH